MCWFAVAVVWIGFALLLSHSPQVLFFVSAIPAAIAAICFEDSM